MTLMLYGTLTATAVLPGSCQSSDTNADLTVQQRSVISDVPVPTGFSLVEEQSRSRSRATWRTVDYLFAGSGEKFAVMRLYEKQMPIHGWTLQDKRFTQGQVMMIYNKDTEQCVITIFDAGGFSPTRLHVDISPKSHLSAGNEPTE
jgi:hypothetical protein